MQLQLSADRADKSLTSALVRAGVKLDLRCGGQGTCGRCRVKLLSGRWQVAGAAVTPPCEVLACQTELAGETGEVEVPESALLQERGTIVAEWQGRPLPCCRESVVAVDLGTTTLAAVKLSGGRIVGRVSRFNPQALYGDNVLARIVSAGNGHLAELQRLIVTALQEMVAELGSSDVVRLAVAGNTVMSCLLHGIDPASIGVLPFTPPQRLFAPRSDLLPDLPLLTLPAISGYLGGDLSINEGDIEQILKAKAAVWAGIETLERYCGAPAQRIWLAGGFARHLNLDHGKAIGMLPERRYEVIGNSSLAGAARLACDPSYHEHLAELIEVPQELPLNRLPGFEESYIDGLLLP